MFANTQQLARLFKQVQRPYASCTHRGDGSICSSRLGVVKWSDMMS